MKNSELLTRIVEAINERTKAIPGDIDAITLRIIRQEVGVIFGDAFTTAPCEHPQRDRYNGFCFICSRTVSDEKGTDASAKDSPNKQSGEPSK